MEFGLKGTSWVCRGRHGEVGIVEFDLNEPKKKRRPDARMGINATLLSSEKSKTPETTRLTDEKHDSSGLTWSSSGTTAMLIILLT